MLLLFLLLLRPCRREAYFRCCIYSPFLFICVYYFVLCWVAARWAAHSGRMDVYVEESHNDEERRKRGVLMLVCVCL